MNVKSKRGEHGLQLSLVPKVTAMGVKKPHIKEYRLYAGEFRVARKAGTKNSHRLRLPPCWSPTQIITPLKA